MNNISDISELLIYLMILPCRYICTYTTTTSLDLRLMSENGWHCLVTYVRILDQLYLYAYNIIIMMQTFLYRLLILALCIGLDQAQDQTKQKSIPVISYSYTCSQDFLFEGSLVHIGRGSKSPASNSAGKTLWRRFFAFCTQYGLLIKRRSCKQGYS